MVPIVTYTRPCLFRSHFTGESGHARPWLGRRELGFAEMHLEGLVAALLSALEPCFWLLITYEVRGAQRMAANVWHCVYPRRGRFKYWRVLLLRVRLVAGSRVRQFCIYGWALMGAGVTENADHGHVGVDPVPRGLPRVH